MASKPSPKTETADKAPKTETAAPVMIKKLSLNKSFPTLKIGQQVTITGTVTKVSTETSQFGEYSKFSGLFFAKDETSGIVISAPTLYLPEIGETLLEGAFDRANGSAVDFHFAVTKVEDKQSKTGYAWGIVPKGETADASKRFLALLDNSAGA